MYGALGLCFTANQAPEKKSDGKLMKGDCTSLIKKSTNDTKSLFHWKTPSGILKDSYS